MQFGSVAARPQEMDQGQVQWLCTSAADAVCALHELKSLRNAQTNEPSIVADRILDKQATCKS